MSVSKQTTITITVTPKLLSRIAKELEEGMERAKLGEYVPHHSFYMGQKLEVKLQADQDAWHRRHDNAWV